MLEIKDLHVEIDNKEILRGVNLNIPAGEVHALMGPNGSGKSTLSCALLGHPSYRVTRGDILFQGESILGWPTDERARRGIFLSFQYPTAIPGVTMTNFLRNVLKNVRGQEVPFREFRSELKSGMEQLGISSGFAARYVNDGFSGGEKKRNEVLQMSLMKPRLAVLDEIDSGLDIDALRILAGGLNDLRAPDRSMLVITHYVRVLNYLAPDRVHVFVDGTIRHSGGRELADRLEAEGYDWVTASAGQGV